MKCRILSLVTLIVLLMDYQTATATEATAPSVVSKSATKSIQRPMPNKLELTLVSIFDGKQPEFIFVIGAVGFKSIDSLKEFLGSQPAGTELTWSPGCKRSGDEPLLSSESQMQDFQKFLKDRGIKFTMTPSG